MISMLLTSTFESDLLNYVMPLPKRNNAGETANMWISCHVPA